MPPARRFVAALLAVLVLAGCARPETRDEAAPCERLGLALDRTESAVGEPVEMVVTLANCGAEPEGHSFDCFTPAPFVEVGGRTYRVARGAATDGAPPCATSSYAGPLTTIPPGHRVSWTTTWDGTVASTCHDGCDRPVPAPGTHVVLVEFDGTRVERSVTFR